MHSTEEHLAIEPTHPSGAHHPIMEGSPVPSLSPEHEMTVSGAWAGHKGPEMNLPTGQSPQTLNLWRCHLLTAQHHPRGPCRAPVSGQRGRVPRGLQETAPGCQSTPGVGPASWPPTLMSGLAPTCPPHAMLVTLGVPSLPQGRGERGAGFLPAQRGGRGTGGAAASGAGTAGLIGPP